MFNFLKSRKDTQVTTQVITITPEVIVQETPIVFKDIRPQWKDLAAKHNISKADMAALCVYRSLVKNQGKEGAIGRLQKSFKPITNPVKLANGAHAHRAVKEALRSISYSTFKTWLSEDELKAVITLAKEIGKEWK